MPATTGMKGEGYYDRNSAPQATAIRLVDDWLAEAAATVALPKPPQPIVAADYGSSEGRNAVGVMRRLAEGLRHRTDQPIQTVYSDLPSNNFNQLFANLTDPSLADGFPAEVYPSAAPGSFYRRLLPPGTVHLALCHSAVLWMDHLPTGLVPDHVVYHRPHPPREGLNVSADAVAAFTRQAATDLAHFLQARAEEMVPGGKLIVSTPADDDRGRTSDGLYDALNDACQDLVAAGRIDRSRYEQLTIPVYFRTAEELVAPLKQAGSPVHGAFTLDRVQAFEVPTPFEVEFERTGNAATYAASYVGFFRAFSEPVMRAALVEPDKDGTVMAALYERAAERIRSEPQRYRFRYVQVAAMLTRC